MPPTSNTVSTAIRRYVFPALIAALVGLCFLPVLDNDFLNWDDNVSFTENLNYRGLTPSHLRWMFTTVLMGHYQPLSWITHALVYGVWGMNPTGYHLANLLLHAANAVVLYFLIIALLQPLSAVGGHADTLGLSVAAAAGTLFFALHPLRVEPVAWATERREVLSALFVLLTVLTYLRAQEEVRTVGRRLPWLVVSLVCYALALLSKATGMTLPLVLLLLDVYPLNRFARAHGRQPLWTAVLIEKLPYMLLATGAAALALVGIRQEAALSLAQHSAAQRAMQAAYGLCFYLWKTVAPFRLSPLYMLEQPLDPTAPQYLVPAFAVVAITIALVLLRRRLPWALAAWACYVVIVSPVLGFAQSGPQIAADRYTYLACLPWAVLAAAGAYRLWLLQREGRFTGPSMHLTVCAITATFIGLGVRTHQQTHVWKDSWTLWNHVLEIDPGNYLGYTNRGVIRRERGDLEGALADYNEAIRLNPQNAPAFSNRGNVRQARGDLDGALADFTQALRLDPADANAAFNRGIARQARRDLDGALADYTLAIRLSPQTATIYYARGGLRQAQGDLTGALADYDAAIRLNPTLAGAHLNRGSARQAMGDVDGALADFSQALRLNPANVNAAFNRGNARKAKGDLDGALADYNQAIQLNPRYAEAYNNRGTVRKTRGDLDGALDDYNAAIRLNPQHANAFNNRGSLRQARGDLEGAIDDYARALQLAPQRPAFERNLAAARQQLAERRNR